MEEERRQLSILVKNPLLFDHIVERVISFVDVEFLPSVRLVSRQWEKFALPKLLQNLNKIPIVFKGQENTSEDDSKMERYLTYIAQEPRLIFNHFILDKTHFSQEMVIFIGTAEITELKLKFNELQSQETLIKMLGSLVNLKTLSLDVDSTCNIPRAFPQDVNPTKILNLKRLCINYTGHHPSRVYTKFIPVLKACKSLDEVFLLMPWWVLRDFYLRTILRNCSNALVEIFTGEMNSEDLKYLMKFQNLKLKALKCESLLLWGGEGVFSEFLEKYKDTLESVVVDEVKIRGIRGSRIFGAHGIRFPEMMPKLKVFQMGLPASSLHVVTGRIDFSPVNFPVQLPSLEKLFLYDGNTKNFQSKCWDTWGFLIRFFDGSDPHKKLTDLRLPFASLKLRRSVEAVFPEITSLKIETGLDGSLHEIWNAWPQLKSLDMTLKGYRKYRVEEFITGTRKNERVQGCSKDVDSNLPSIVNLKDLKRFKLRLIGCGGSLSDFSVSRAFCKLPCLEFLLLSHHNISVEGTKELLKYHSLLKKVDCPFHPEVYKIQREYLPNDFIPSDFSTEDSDSGCDCSFSE